jgi:hypothetical protein
VECGSGGEWGGFKEKGGVNGEEPLLFVQVAWSPSAEVFVNQGSEVIFDLDAGIFEDVDALPESVLAS